MSNYQSKTEIKNKTLADTIELKNRKKVFVGMSGGVDSSVATHLLKEAGYDVTGVFMRCYNIDGCAEKDAEDARRVAEKLNIPFYVWDFEEEYKKKVVEYMIVDYTAGRTPNPDVACNREIKFGLFLSRALSLGADYIATGHYVKLGNSVKRQAFSVKENLTLGPERYTLYAARDSAKDQSYFLWTLTQKDLKYCLFPLGELLKPEVREIAKKAGLPTAEKKDSQGICFLGRVDLRDFLSLYIPKKRGDVVDVDGGKIGEHDGARFYTVGQRRGLDVGEKNKTQKISAENKKGSALKPGTGATKPHYVVSVDIENNIVVVAEGENNPALFKNEILLEKVNFINLDLEKSLQKNSINLMARIRYRQPLFKARLEKGENQIYRLVFNEPQKFVAPGQSAVFYARDGNLLGGGIIKSVG